jgi:hypothetical protein
MARKGFRSEHVFVGRNIQVDVRSGTARLDFALQARPRADEDIAEDTRRLFGLCERFRVDHPICAGFAINWCLFMSRAGMLEMSRHGVMCSALRRAVTPVENNETARRELWKDIALGRVALAFGSGFDMADFIAPVPDLASRAA